MPLDHFVPQVHLKNFCSPTLKNLLYAIRKSDLKRFTPRPADVCRIQEGNTNAYLLHNRAVEDFLLTIEPRYNDSVAKLRTGTIDAECIYVCAGFIAYVNSCSPTAMRLHTPPLQGMVEMQAVSLDAQGLMPPAPPQLRGLNLTEILWRGLAVVDVDPRFPQAIGIASILRNTVMFGNFHWEILRNEFYDSPFLTSDFPIAIESSSDPTVVNKIVPLSPDLAVRIMPDRTRKADHNQIDFRNFTHTRKNLTRKQVGRVNQLIVRSAEEVVFFRDDRPWVFDFVMRNAAFRLETIVTRSPNASGITWRQEITRTGNATLPS